VVNGGARSCRQARRSRIWQTRWALLPGCGGPAVARWAAGSGSRRPV